MSRAVMGGITSAVAEVILHSFPSGVLGQGATVRPSGVVVPMGSLLSDIAVTVPGDSP